MVRGLYWEAGEAGSNQRMGRCPKPGSPGSWLSTWTTGILDTGGRLSCSSILVLAGKYTHSRRGDALSPEDQIEPKTV